MINELCHPSIRTPSKCIVVACANTRYHVVRTAAVQLGWHVEDGDREDVPPSFHGISLGEQPNSLSCAVASRGIKYDAAISPQILWLDKSVVGSRVATLSCFHRINHFAGMHVIARKAVLFRRLMRIRRQPDLAAPLSHALASFPWSFTPSTELLLLERFISDCDGGDIFILKPNKGCQGKGIVVTPEPLRVLSRMTPDEMNDCLVQQYVTRPLCIDRKKFDLRIYVLITSVVEGKPPRRGLHCTSATANKCDKKTTTPLDGLKLFVHYDGLVRICTEDYAFPSEANCRHENMHLTNYAVNKTAGNFAIEEVDADCGGGDGVTREGNKRDFKFLEEYINALPSDSYTETEGVCSTADGSVGSRWSTVLRRIDRCILLTVLSGLEVLQREFVGAGASRGSRSDAQNCFELLGFDVLLTEDLEPVLMEVNHSPSLFCESKFDFRTKQRVVMDVFRTLEPYVPSIENCRADSYAILQGSSSGRSGDCATGFRQISPTRVEGGGWTEEEMEMFRDMHTRAAKLR